MEGSPRIADQITAKCSEGERQFNNEKIRFRKLKGDFEYNLKLLEERDQELQRCIVFAG